MVKFLILFHQPQDTAAFEGSYNDFLALIERMPDIRRRQVVNVLGSPVGQPRYYRILEIYFDDKAALENSLRSKAGQEAGAELSRRFPADSYETLFADVYEETGGRTTTNL
jgi:uncharacterized protein (TIGR02118 family)